MADGNAKELLTRSEKLFDGRQSTLSLWQELGDQFYPERAEFTTVRDPGESFASHLFSTDPVMMRRDLGNQISAMTRPGSKQWGIPRVNDEKLMDDQVNRAYLDWLGKVQWSAMYDERCNFVRSTKEADHDLVTFGNAVLSAEVNQTAGRLRYMCHHLRDCAWSVNRDGVTDLMNRKFKLQARVAKQMFSMPGDVLHEKIHKACEKEPFKEFNFLHVMMPADDYDYVSRESRKRSEEHTSELQSR